MSNQNKGADSRSCPWCSIHLALFSAAGIEIPDDCRWDHRLRLLAWKTMAKRLQSCLISQHGFEDGEACANCQRCEQIRRNEMLGPRRRAWRETMWRDNPEMRHFMRQGKHDAEFAERKAGE
jgi:hypothetical protein